jgi:hypothetical protein
MSKLTIFLHKISFLLFIILQICTTSCKQEVKQAVSGSNTAPVSALQPMPPFTHIAPVPEKGTLYGVVEMGATGFNSFVVNIDAQKNWVLAQKPEYGSSLVLEHMATEEDIKEGLKNYIKKIMEKGVTSKNIHFVVSSGAKDEENVQKIIVALGKINYRVNTVTAEEEGTCALKAVLPTSFYDKSFVMDIGSANTKLSYAKENEIIASESYGSKYFQKAIPDSTAYGIVRKVADAIPSDRTEYCFIIGGVPFELAKQIRREKERYTVLRLPDDYKASGDKQRAGLNIYKAVADATGCKNFVFDWDANFTIGFLLNLKK